MLRRRCIQNGCREYAIDGRSRCPTHSRRRACLCGTTDCQRHSRSGYTHPPPANLYAYRSGWQARAKRVLVRDGYVCQLRFPGICIGKASQVDHIVQPGSGGNAAHAVGIARDLNLLDITAIQTAAGTVTAFDAANLDRNVRAAILKVAAATLGRPEDVVLFGTSTALAIANGYAPVDGDGRGSVTTRVFGARVYVDEQALAGNVYAFNPAGFIVFQTGLRSASTLDPTNGSPKFGSWLHSTGPATFIVGAAAGVDLVTP